MCMSVCYNELMWKHLDNPLSVSSSLVIVVLIAVIVVQAIFLASDNDTCPPCETQVHQEQAVREIAPSAEQVLAPETATSTGN